MPISGSISRERLAAAYRNDARRVILIATPLFTAGFVLEALGHLTGPGLRMVIQPAVSACICASVLFLSRRRLQRVAYPEFILLLLWSLVMWNIALHFRSVEEVTRASTLVMLAVATVGCATLIMPTLAAGLAIGVTFSMYVYGQSVYVSDAGASALVAPALVFLVAVIIYHSRRSAIRSVEELRQRVAEDQRELEHVNEQLRNLSVTDPLTETLNRRGFDQRLRAELIGAARRREPLSLMLLDIDYFKAYNDEFGHPAGDAALVSVANALKGCCRGNDLVARYGGEEFAVVLPATDAAGSQRMGDRVRKAVAASSGLCRPITVSVGCATIQPLATADTGDSALNLVSAADDALYRAKQAGRDRIEFAEAVEV